MSVTWQALPFNDQEFHKVVCNAYLVPDELRTKRIVNYLFRYLVSLKAETIIVEEEYVDADFLDDYAAYYARCYSPIAKKCCRLHFFKSSISPDDVLRIVSVGSPEETEKVNSNYLGFIVVRPLPQALIGRTVLIPYDSDGGRRHYTCLRKYAVNLFGVPLALRSLAFQEQDKVLAACATVALWSAFHATAAKFNTTTPTPSAITISANKLHRGRPIPSHGLFPQEICAAIAHVGLEPELVDVKASVPLLSLLYAYLRCGLPVILGVIIVDEGHAITLTGYSLKDAPIHQAESSPPGAGKSIALRISSFYGHDDQIGPFSRLKVVPASAPGKNANPLSFESSWEDPKTGKLLELRPYAVITPVYHKIRLTFLDVSTAVAGFQRLAELVASGLKMTGTEWDIHLIFSNDYKSELRSATHLHQEVRTALLFRPHPRFVWRVIMRCGGKEILELLLDATAFSRSNPVYEAAWYDTNVGIVFKALLTDQNAVDQIRRRYIPRSFLNVLQDAVNRQFT